MEKITAYKCEYCGKLFLSNKHKCYKDPNNKSCIICAHYRSYENHRWCNVGVEKGYKGFYGYDVYYDIPFTFCDSFSYNLENNHYPVYPCLQNCNPEYVPKSVVLENIEDMEEPKC